MDQLLGKEVAGHLQDIALAIFLIISVIGAVAHRSLVHHLKPRENSEWKMVDIPDFSQRESMRDEIAFVGTILTRSHRHSEIRNIRLLGDLNLACIVVMWAIALAVIMFGDLGRYDFVLHFRS